MLKRQLVDNQCKYYICKIAKEYNIEPRLITTLLMSEEDKDDMRFGNLPIHILELHVSAWIKAGMPDYVKPNYKNI